MKIVWQEMKKIVSVKKLLYLAGFYALYFMLFLKPYVRQPHAFSYHQEADLVKSFIEEYGVTLTPEEFQELKSRQPEYVYDEIDQYIASNQEFQELGIRNFREFTGSQRGKELTLEEDNRLWLQLYDAIPADRVTEKVTSEVTNGIWNQYIDTYEQETAGRTVYYKDLNQTAQQERLKERGEKEVYGLMPGGVLYTNFEVLRLTGSFMTLAMLFMILPYMVSENRSRMPSLQYSFQKGRRHYGCRVAAVLLSCVLIAALTVAVYMKIAAGNRVTDFWNCSISAYSTAYISWFPWTLGEYTVFHLLIAAAFSTGLALGVFVVSHYLENYVTAIAWVLPAVVGGVFFCGIVLCGFGEITRAKWSVPLTGAGILGLGIVAALLEGCRERRRDIGMF
ncbi:MAG: hypothetical protein HFH87_06235 [Lachnospiraceae bacterium]|nr:hypothetical protein [Lachnospiraceae bacterium]